MAEIFAIVAAVISLVDVAARLTDHILEIRVAWKNIPPQILAIADETQDLTLVLQYTKDACEAIKLRSSSSAFPQALEEHIRTAHAVLLELQDLLNSLQNVADLKRWRRWVRIQPAVVVKRSQIHNIRVSIGELLRAYQLYVCLILTMIQPLILGAMDTDFYAQPIRISD